MRIAFVQTYPIYHDLTDTETWLKRRDRVRRIPGILSTMGHEVELWAADRSASVHTSEMDGFGDYPIRFFEGDEVSRKTKKHYSDALVDHARTFDADIHLLKGTDGGVGERLIKQYLLPEDKPFVFVIGGEYYTRFVPKADLVFYETEEQRKKLRDPGWYLWRTAVPDDRLLRMPKSIDTEQFRPMPEVEKEWDIMSVGRLIPRYKSYDALGELSEAFDVAVVGDGPARDDLESKYPKVDWVGSVPHPKVPEMLNRARVFMHAGHRDYFPRVIPEAEACGLPVLAFAHAIAPDVLPPGCGLRLHQDHYPEEVQALFDQPGLIEDMGKRARKHAVDSLGKFSAREPMETMIRKLGGPQPSSTESSGSESPGL